MLNQLHDQAPPELVAVRKFVKDLGIHPCTFWRWEQHGRIGPVLNIAGRKYLTRGHITEFLRRAEAGEFAVEVKPPVRRVA